VTSKTWTISKRVAGWGWGFAERGRAHYGNGGRWQLFHRWRVGNLVNCVMIKLICIWWVTVISLVISSGLILQQIFPFLDWLDFLWCEYYWWSRLSKAASTYTANDCIKKSSVGREIQFARHLFPGYFS
jgi:hypothetical protein